MPVPETVPMDLPGNFAAGLRSLYSLCLVSLGFGAIALAAGLWFIVAAFLAGTFGAFQLVLALAGWASLVVGVRWLMAGWKILAGVSPILRDYEVLEGAAATDARAKGGPMVGEVPEPPVPESEPAPGAVHLDAIRELVRRMMVHYRENWKTWWKMAPLSRMGGGIFIIMGLLEFYRVYSSWDPAGTGTVLVPLVAGALFIALGAEALLLAAKFQASARAWERRLIDAGMGGEFPQDHREGA
jgi:hypothetical protein